VSKQPRETHKANELFEITQFILQPMELKKVWQGATASAIRPRASSLPGDSMTRRTSSVFETAR